MAAGDRDVVRGRATIVSRKDGPAPCSSPAHDSEDRRGTGTRRRAVRRRLRRRHAADRRPFHQRDRRAGQRPGHAAGLPSGDPGAGRDPRRRLGVPDPLRLPRHHHAGRPAERPGGDEPGRAEDQPRVARARRHPHRQRGRVHRPQPGEGGVQGQPARGRFARRLPGVPGADDAERSKNMFALGLVSWMFGRPTDVTIRWIEQKFAGKEDIRDANIAAFKAGYNFGETTELFAHSYEVKPFEAKPGTYRNASGATALAWGLIAASVRSGLPLFYASYPITPASELLHELSRRKNFGVRTLQAEDEIAAAGAALGAAFGGALGVTGTSGPGLDLKTETIGLAVTLELPMVIVDVQRAGPSTGMPTKTEAADLLAAMYG